MSIILDSRFVDLENTGLSTTLKLLFVYLHKVVWLLLHYCIYCTPCHSYIGSHNILIQPAEPIAAFFEENDYEFMEISQYKLLLFAVFTKLNVFLLIRGLPWTWQLKEAMLR